MDQLGKLLDRVWKVTTRAGVFSAIILVGIVLYRDIVGDTIVIETINVPRSLEQQGLGAEVIATRLRSELNTLLSNSGTSMHSASVASSNTPTGPDDVVVPGTGLTVSSLSTWISTRLLTDRWRGVLNLPERKTASGEIQRVGDTYKLILRLNEKSIYATTVPVVSAEIDKEVHAAAIELAKKTFPYTYAVYLYTSNHEDSAELDSLLDWIIRTFPEENENVIRAHVLRGFLLEEQHDYADAIDEFAWSRKLAEQAGTEDAFEIASFHLANAELSELDNDLSNEQYIRRLEHARQLVSLASSHSEAHDMLGWIYHQEAMRDESGEVKAALFVASKREYDIAASFTKPDPAAFANRANLLEWRDPVRDIDQIVSDRRMYVRTMMAANNQRVEDDLWSQYYKLANELMNQESSVGTHAHRVAPSGFANMAYVTEAIASSVDPLLPPVIGESPAALTEVALQKAAIIREACMMLRAAFRRWNPDNGETSVEAMTMLVSLDAEAKRLNPGAARSCIESPGLRPTDY